MFSAIFDGTETKLFYNGIHIETWNKETSMKARDIFLADYFNDCKCVDCVVGGAVNQYLNKQKVEV